MSAHFPADPAHPTGPWGVPPQPPKPGVIPLRPLGVGDILDGAITYLRANPRVTVGLSAVIALIGQVLIQATRLVDPVPAATGDPAGLGAFFDLFTGGEITQGAGILVGLAVSVVLTGMLIPVLAGAVLGRRSTLRDVWAIGGSRIGGLLAITLLTLLGAVLAYLAVSMVGMMAASALMAVGAPMWAFWAAMAIVFMAAVAVAVHLWVGWALAPAVYVLEGTTIRGALRGSRALVRGRFWRVFGIMVLAQIIAGLISSALTILPVGLGALAVTDPGTTTVVLAVALATVGGIVAGAITTPFLAGVSGLLYVDLRIRRDGLDIRLGQVAALDGITVQDAFRPLVPPTPQPPSAETGWPQAS